MTATIARLLVDSSGNEVGIVLDGTVYRLQTVGKVLNAAGTQVNPATQETLASLDGKDYATQTTLATRASEATLAAIKDTAGVKKITDPLPAGTNIIGGMRLFDHASVALAVDKATTIPASTKHLLVGGEHTSDGKAYRARMIDDTDTAALKRILVEAAIKPGSSISTTPTAASLDQAVRDFVLNGGSKDLNVDGSSTPVEFTYNAHGTKDTHLTEVRFIFNCSTINMKGDDFGSDVPLTNGVKFEVTSNGITTELANFVINEDFLALPGSGGADLIYDGPANDQLIASFFFGGAVTLVGGTGDNVKVTIRDDCTFGSAHKVVLFWAAVTGIMDE